MKKSENVKLNDGFKQVCVWPGTIVVQDENKKQEYIDNFVKSMEEYFKVKVQYLEEIKTRPDIQDEISVDNTGERNDLFFAIHNDDINKFAIPRLKAGIRWIEDVLSKENYNSPIYPSRVFKYKCW